MVASRSVAVGDLQASFGRRKFASVIPHSEELDGQVYALQGLLGDDLYQTSYNENFRLTKYEHLDPKNFLQPVNAVNCYLPGP